jgi:hypothetical protein
MKCERRICPRQFSAPAQNVVSKGWRWKRGQGAHRKPVSERVPSINAHELGGGGEESHLPPNRIGTYLTGIYLMDVLLTGMYLMSVLLIGVHLIGGIFMGLIGVHFMGVYLIYEFS